MFKISKACRRGFFLVTLQAIAYIFCFYIAIAIGPRCEIDGGDPFCMSLLPGIRRYIDPFSYLSLPVDSFKNAFLQVVGIFLVYTLVSFGIGYGITRLTNRWETALAAKINKIAEAR